VRIFEEPARCRSNYWLHVLLLDEPSRTLRDEILNLGCDRKIGVRPAWTLMHRLPMFAAAPRMDLSVSENLEERIICLPSSPHLVPANA